MPSKNPENCIGLYAEQLTAEIFTSLSDVLDVTATDARVCAAQERMRKIIVRETIIREE